MKNFLSKEKLNSGEIIFFILYSFVTLTLLFLLDFLKNKELARILLFFYSVGTIFFLYIFGYKSLRKLKFALIWIFISFVHIVFFIIIKDDIDLYFKKGHSGYSLNFTILAVILFQILRFMSLKIEKKDLVCPSSNGIDLFDNRKTNFLDSIFFIIYMFAFIGFIIITGK